MNDQPLCLSIHEHQGYPEYPGLSEDVHPWLPPPHVQVSQAIRGCPPMANTSILIIWPLHANTYLSDADFCLYILQSLLKDRNESSRWNGCPVDARLVYMALETEREGTVLKPTLQQVSVHKKVYLIACDAHPAKLA